MEDDERLEHEKLPFVDTITPELTTRRSIVLFMLAPLAWLRIITVAAALWILSMIVLAFSFGVEPSNDAFLPKLHHYGLVRRITQVISGCARLLCVTPTGQTPERGPGEAGLSGQLRHCLQRHSEPHSSGHFPSPLTLPPAQPTQVPHPLLRLPLPRRRRGEPSQSRGRASVLPDGAPLIFFSCAPVGHRPATRPTASDLASG